VDRDVNYYVNHQIESVWRPVDEFGKLCDNGYFSKSSLEDASHVRILLEDGSRLIISLEEIEHVKQN